MGYEPSLGTDYRSSINNAVIYVFTTSAKLSTLPIVEGQLILCTDTNECFYDSKTKRYFVGGADTEEIMRRLGALTSKVNNLEQRVDMLDGDYLLLSGGTMEGDIVMDNHSITDANNISASAILTTTVSPHTEVGGVTIYGGDALAPTSLFSLVGNTIMLSTPEELSIQSGTTTWNSDTYTLTGDTSYSLTVPKTEVVGYDRITLTVYCGDTPEGMLDSAYVKIFNDPLRVDIYGDTLRMGGCSATYLCSEGSVDIHGAVVRINNEYPITTINNISSPSNNVSFVTSEDTGLYLTACDDKDTINIKLYANTWSLKECAELTPYTSAIAITKVTDGKNALTVPVASYNNPTYTNAIKLYNSCTAVGMSVGVYSGSPIYLAKEDDMQDGFDYLDVHVENPISNCGKIGLKLKSGDNDIKVCAEGLYSMPYIGSKTIEKCSTDNSFSVKISSTNNNALIVCDDGLYAIAQCGGVSPYTGTTPVKVSGSVISLMKSAYCSNNNIIEFRDDGIYAPPPPSYKASNGIDISDTHAVSVKYDDKTIGLSSSKLAVKTSATAGNNIKICADGLYVPTPTIPEQQVYTAGTAISEVPLTEQKQISVLYEPASMTLTTNNQLAVHIAPNCNALKMLDDNCGLYVAPVCSGTAICVDSENKISFKGCSWDFAMQDPPDAMTNTVSLKTSTGLSRTATGLQVHLKQGGGVCVDSDGLFVDTNTFGPIPYNAGQGISIEDVPCTDGVTVIKNVISTKIAPCSEASVNLLKVDTTGLAVWKEDIPKVLSSYGVTVDPTNNALSFNGCGCDFHYPDIGCEDALKAQKVHLRLGNGLARGVYGIVPKLKSGGGLDMDADGIYVANLPEGKIYTNSDTITVDNNANTMHVNISTCGCNTLVFCHDGLYVPRPIIKSGFGVIVTEADIGTHVISMCASSKEGNIATVCADGIYVPTPDIPTVKEYTAGSGICIDSNNSIGVKIAPCSTEEQPSGITNNLLKVTTSGLYVSEADLPAYTGTNGICVDATNRIIKTLISTCSGNTLSVDEFGGLYASSPIAYEAEGVIAITENKVSLNYNEANFTNNNSTLYLNINLCTDNILETTECGMYVKKYTSGNTSICVDDNHVITLKPCTKQMCDSEQLTIVTSCGLTTDNTGIRVALSGTSDNSLVFDASGNLYVPTPVIPDVPKYTGTSPICVDDNSISLCYNSGTLAVCSNALTVNISSCGNNALSTYVDGLYVNADYTGTCSIDVDVASRTIGLNMCACHFKYGDSNTGITLKTGTGITKDASGVSVKISSDSNNAIISGSDNGIYVPKSNLDYTAGDGIIISGDKTISTLICGAYNNMLTLSQGFLYVPSLDASGYLKNEATGQNSLAILNNFADGNAVSLGYEASAECSAVAIGYGAYATSRSVVIGSSNCGTGTGSVTIGHNSVTNDGCSVAVGAAASVNGAFGVSLGFGTSTCSGIAIGNSAIARGKDITLATSTGLDTYSSSMNGTVSMYTPELKLMFHGASLNGCNPGYFWCTATSSGHTEFGSSGSSYTATAPILIDTSANDISLCYNPCSLELYSSALRVRVSSTCGNALSVIGDGLYVCSGGACRATALVETNNLTTLVLQSDMWPGIFKNATSFFGQTGGTYGNLLTAVDVTKGLDVDDCSLGGMDLKIARVNVDGISVKFNDSGQLVAEGGLTPCGFTGLYDDGNGNMALRLCGTGLYFTDDGYLATNGGDGGLQNLATGDCSLSILGEATTSNYSTSVGVGANASGNSSTAIGRQATASDRYSTAIGYCATASGNYSTALGYCACASCYGSTALGRSATASGQYSTSLGHYACANGGSVALGSSSMTTDAYSIAIGYEAKNYDWNTFLLSGCNFYVKFRSGCNGKGAGIEYKESETASAEYFEFDSSGSGSSYTGTAPININDNTDTISLNYDSCTLKVSSSKLAVNVLSSSSNRLGVCSNGTATGLYVPEYTGSSGISVSGSTISTVLSACGDNALRYDTCGRLYVPGSSGSTVLNKTGGFYNKEDCGGDGWIVRVGSKKSSALTDYENALQYCYRWLGVVDSSGSVDPNAENTLVVPIHKACSGLMLDTSGGYLKVKLDDMSGLYIDSSGVLRVKISEMTGNQISIQYDGGLYHCGALY